MPCLVLADRVAREIDMNSAGQRERDNQRRRHQKIRLDVLMHARFEISISRKDRSCNQIVFVDRLLDIRMQRSGVADAGGATVADKVESELIEIFLQPGFVEIIRKQRASRARAKFSPQDRRAEPRSTAFFASRPAAIITLGLLVFVQLVIAAIRTLPCPM